MVILHGVAFWFAFRLDLIFWIMEKEDTADSRL